MKKFLCVVALLVPMSVFATQTFIPKPPLNIINYTVQAEQWAKTKQAKVIVSFNGTMQAADLANVHTDLLTNLSKLASPAEWHITQFQRRKDQSDLENIYATAEARLDDNQLARLRPMAKQLTKPGAKFEIMDIQFTPSLSTLEIVRQNLRQQIYLRAKVELAALEKLYPDQKYVVHRIVFDPVRVSMPRGDAMNFAVMKAGAPMASSSGGMAVSLKVTMSASIEFANILKA